MFSRPRSRPVGIRRGNYRYSVSIASISRSQGNPRLRWRHVAEQHGKRPVWHLKRPLFAWLTKCRGCGARLDTHNPKLPLPRGSYSSFTQTLLAGRWIDFALRLDRLLYLGKSSAFTGRAFYFCYFSFGCLHEFHFPKLRKGTSNQIRRDPLNSRHIVMKNGLLAAIIPFDSCARTIPFREDALIIWISIPADAVADSEGSGWLPVITHSRYGGTAASIVRRKPLV